VFDGEMGALFSWLQVSGDHEKEELGSDTEPRIWLINGAVKSKIRFSNWHQTMRSDSLDRKTSRAPAEVGLLRPNLTFKVLTDEKATY
jgi:hypothetical protein